MLQSLPNAIFVAGTGVVLCMYTLMSLAPGAKLVSVPAQRSGFPPPL